LLAPPAIPIFKKKENGDELGGATRNTPRHASLESLNGEGVPAPTFWHNVLKRVETIIRKPLFLFLLLGLFLLR